MGFLSDITSAIGEVISPVSDLLGGGLSYLGTQSQNQQSAANQASANQFSAQQFATRYQTTVKDLQAAGLNPMLAYGATPNAPSSQTPAPVQNAMGSAVSAYQRSKEVNSATKLQAEQSLQARTAADLNSASAMKQRADAIVATKDAELKDEQIKNEKMRNPNIQALTRAYEGQATASAASAAQSAKMVEQLTQNIDNLKAELKNIKQKGDVNAPEADIAKKYPTFYYLFHKLMPTLSGSTGSISNYIPR